MARERYQYAARQRAYRNPQDVERDKFYEDEIMRYAGESLTIESITVGLFEAQVSAFVRFDAGTAFSITIHKAQWQLFTDAGYTLPCKATHDKGTYPFTADITCEWRKALYGREIGLHVKTVEPKAEETMQPENNEHAETVKAELELPYATSDLVDFANAFNVVETPAITATIDYAAILSQLHALRDMLATDILGLTGDALDTATASANAAHYIGNAIGSLERIVPVIVADSGKLDTEELPQINDTAA